ncbi:DNA-binding SARP family transcriptional activator [Actinomadura pelletieri DSM 43383]|uniref:DNA-binding SARP family transcriptional activator n=1 Tax=Actinomadura pelletieri DSM 43383 TaxID=1120940 RepID=A0A495QXV3_9ACTN|nr:AfsR/SARP family transcriptional regulator [Actinomadura pelletieri]RKS78746.1 DNA-binding SARP family transcriptional activator [Actinomadura pelletieri DSM 43383]
MEVRLLGTVSAWFGGREAVLRSGRALGLLAVLAWEPNQVIPDSVLIDRIWDEALPRHPQAALYTLAARLRAAFDEPERVERRCGGYVLVADPGDIDVHRFRGVVREARGKVWDGEDAAAVLLFDRAIGMWRGAQLAGVSGAWADRVRMTLGQERLAAQLACVGARLRLGRHDETVPLLAGLAEEYPLDEQIASLLMVALYRCGRQGEALDRYAAVRSRLVGVLGVEPGASIRELHRSILHGALQTMHIPSSLPRSDSTGYAEGNGVST